MYLLLTGPDSAIFVSDLQDGNFFEVLLLITFRSYIYIIFQGLKVIKSHKIVGIKVFLTISLDDTRMDPDP